MIEYYGENPAKPPNPVGAFFKTIAFLRIGTGLTLLIRHGVAAVLGAYHFLWDETPWNWAKSFAKAEIPYPHLAAPAVAMVIASVGVSWTLGFLTRFFAILFLPVIITAIGILARSASPHLEAAWLYALISFTLLLFGSGSISIDRLFRLSDQLSGSKKRRQTTSPKKP